MIRTLATVATVAALAAAVTAGAQSKTKRQPHVQAVTEKVDWTSGVTYSYDGGGNVISIGSDKFLYDDVGRLVKAVVTGSERNYRYDAFGNRTGCTLAGGGDCQYDVDIDPTNNRMKDATYDPNGAGLVKAFGPHTYSYDAVNMMTRDKWGEIATSEFVYTADDERIAVYAPKTGAWQWTLRDTQNKVLRELTSEDGSAGRGNANWKWMKDYVWREGLLLASRQLENDNGNERVTTYHYHLDHLSTPRRITDDNDAIVGSHDYFAFGAEVSGGVQEPARTDLKYTAHERDTLPDQYSLDYMHARYYNYSIGRFLTPDPRLTLEKVSRTPQAWNRYAYAGNNPMMHLDRDGMDWTLYIRDASGGGTTNFGHVAIRVFGNGYDAVYDYGRYGDTEYRIFGEGTLRVWDHQWGKFLAAQSTKGKGTEVTWQTTAAMDQSMMAYFAELIGNGRPVASASPYAAYFKQYLLGGEYARYNLFGPNCTTISLDALRKVAGDHQASLEILSYLAGVSPANLLTRVKVMQDPELRRTVNYVPGSGELTVTVNGSRLPQ